MAVKFVRNHTAQQTKTAGTNINIQISGSNNDAGSVLVAFLGADNLTASTPTVSSISKPASESASWVLLGRVGSSNAGAALGCVGEVWAIKTTTQWGAAFNASATWSGSIAAKTSHMVEFSGVTILKRGVEGTGTSVAGTPTATSTGEETNDGDLVVGFGVSENNAVPPSDADTLNGVWATVLGVATTGGGADTNNAICFQWKIVNAAGHQTFNPVGGTDSGAIIVALAKVPDPAQLPPAIPVMSGAPSLVPTSLIFAPVSFDDQVIAAPEVPNIDLAPAILDFSATPVSTSPNVDLAPAGLGFSSIAVTPSPNVNLTPAVISFSAVPFVSIGQANDLTPAILNFSATPLSITPNINLTPAILNFQAQPIPPTTNIAITPAVINFSAVPNSKSVNVNLTPAILSFSAVANSKSINVNLTPAVLAFSAIAGIKTPNVNLTSAVINFSGRPLSTSANINLTPAILVFSAVELVFSGGLNPAILNFSAVPLIITPNIDLAPAILSFTARPLVTSPNVNLAAALINFQAVAFLISQNVLLTPAILNFVAVALQTATPDTDDLPWATVGTEPRLVVVAVGGKADTTHVDHPQPDVPTAKGGSDPDQPYVGRGTGG